MAASCMISMHHPLVSLDFRHYHLHRYSFSSPFSFPPCASQVSTRTRIIIIVATTTNSCFSRFSNTTPHIIDWSLYTGTRSVLAVGTLEEIFIQRQTYLTQVCVWASIRQGWLVPTVRVIMMVGTIYILFVIESGDFSKKHKKYTL